MRNTRKARFCLFAADLKRNLSHLIYLHRKLQSPLKTPKRRKNSRILQIMFFTSTFGLILDSFVIYCNVNQLKFNIMKTLIERVKPSLFFLFIRFLFLLLLLLLLFRHRLTIFFVKSCTFIASNLTETIQF